MGVTFIRKYYVFKGFRTKSKLLFNVFKVLPSKHRKPHAWIREQRSKSAHLPDPTHAGTKYPRSGEPLTPTEPPTPCFYRQRPGRHVAAVATGHGMMGTDTVTVPPTATVTVTDTVTVQPTVTLTGTDTVTAQPTATATATQASCMTMTRDHKPDLKDERARLENAVGRVVFDGYANQCLFVQSEYAHA